MSVCALPQGFLCVTHTAQEPSMRTIARPFVVVLTTLAGLCGAAPSSAKAQADGTIRGKVVSRADQHPIPYARVSVVGANRTAVTNQQGEYVIADVPAGSHVVRVRMIGFG